MMQWRHCLECVYSDTNLNTLTASLSSKCSMHHIHRSIYVTKNTCSCKYKPANTFICCFYLNNEVLWLWIFFFSAIHGGNKYFEKYQRENGRWQCILMYFNVSKKGEGLKLACVCPIKMESINIWVCLASTVTQLK